MAHFNFVISQNAKWGHAGTGKYSFTKKALLKTNHPVFGWGCLCLCMVGDSDLKFSTQVDLELRLNMIKLSYFILFILTAQ